MADGAGAGADIGVRDRGEIGIGVGEDLEFTACPCNTSYASLSCCKSVDGMVWEPLRDSKLGDLRGL
jgi:hypothetical protein